MKTNTFYFQQIILLSHRNNNKPLSFFIISLYACATDHNYILSIDAAPILYHLFILKTQVGFERTITFMMLSFHTYI